MKETFTLAEVKKIASDVMNLGMELRQDQLSWYSSKSKNELLDDYFNEMGEEIIGFANIYMDVATKHLYISETPYPTIEDAEQGMFVGSNILKVGCFEIKLAK